MIVGTTEPFNKATLVWLYPGGQREYLKKFEASLSSAIKAGFILPADKHDCAWRIAIQASSGSSNNPWQWLCQR